MTFFVFFYLELCCWLPPNIHHAATEHDRRAGDDKDAGEDLHTSPAARVIQDGTSDRARNQARKRSDQEGDSRAESDLRKGRNLGHQRADEGHVGAGEEAKERGVGNGARLARGGDPERQREQACRVAADAERVELAQPIGAETRGQPAEQARGVQDRHQVLRQVHVHAVGESVGGDVVDRDVDTESGKKLATCDILSANIQRGICTGA